MSRLGGITYGRLQEGIEIPRPDWKEQTEGGKADDFIKPKIA